MTFIHRLNFRSDFLKILSQLYSQKKLPMLNIKHRGVFKIIMRSLTFGAISHLPSNCEISLIDVEKGLSSFNNVKSAGLNGLPGTLLFNMRSVICFPLWLIFCRSLKDGVYPLPLKMCSVTSIFKSGDKTKVRNYRLISIQNHITKLFELLVLKFILPSVNSVLMDEQYGFRPQRSAT